MKEPFLQKLRREVARTRGLLACWVQGRTASGRRHQCNELGYCSRCDRIIKGRAFVSMGPEAQSDDYSWRFR